MEISNEQYGSEDAEQRRAIISETIDKFLDLDKAEHRLFADALRLTVIDDDNHMSTMHVIGSMLGMLMAVYLGHKLTQMVAEKSVTEDSVKETITDIHDDVIPWTSHEATCAFASNVEQFLDDPALGHLDRDEMEEFRLEMVNTSRAKIWGATETKH